VGVPEDPLHVGQRQLRVMGHPGLRQSHVIMAWCCGDTPRLAFSRPGW
jgi:hypothetical protein